MIVDESRMTTWAVPPSQPACDVVLVERDRHLKCRQRGPPLTVLTAEPLRRGVHYFQFVMHHTSDEQWCGLVQDSSQAGTAVPGRRLRAWAYYTGRVWRPGVSPVDGHGALHAEGKAVAKFQTLAPEGDVIGMLADMGAGAIAFDLNGVLQGACPIPRGAPLWVFSTLSGTLRDHLELRKPSVNEAPSESLAALGGPLLDPASGHSLSFHPFGGHAWPGSGDDENSDDDDDVDGDPSDSGEDE